MPPLPPWLTAYIAIAALLVGLTSLAWNIQRDIRTGRRQRTQETEARRHAAAAADAALIAAERQRRAAVLRSLRQEWIASHDGISPAMLAGTEPLPKSWVDARLAQLGEGWRQDEYR